MPMRPDIQRDVLKALEANFTFRRSGEWLRGGKCPQCGKKEVYTHAESPRVLKCSRLGRCGWEAHVKELYPEIFDNWSDRYRTTESDPNAAADAYLSHARGLDLQGLRGAYSQEWYRDPERGIGTATVRFQLPGGSWWERLIDQPGRFEKKARFAYAKSWRGHWWRHPEVSLADLAAADTIWINEGIFDALSLEQAGQRAVSIMACNVYPEIALDELRKAIANGPNPTHQPRLIWALDVGKAGTEWTRKHVARARKEGWECGAAQVRDDTDPGRKLDWNDLLLRKKLRPEHREDYLWHGDVLIAPTASEKAFLIWQRRQWSSFHFVFETRTWWAEFSQAKIAETIQGYAEKSEVSALSYEQKRDLAAREAGLVREIANCAFRVLYRQRDEATDETAYFFNIDFPSDRPSTKGGFAANAISASAEFKKRLLAVGTGAIWTGSQNQLDRIMQRQMPAIPDIETIGFTGYSRDHGAYIFPDIAVMNGRVFRPNDDDFFDLAKDVQVKLGTSERLLEIEYNPDAFDTDWVADLWTAFGAKGIVTLGFFFATLFAEQIRRDRKSFPFLEMWGDPGSGKTTLVEFLWKLFGRENYEGFDPAKATQAALARNLGKVGNLPVVLIEGDRNEEASHARRFEWEELKTAYNGRSVRSRGVRNSGNETYEPPFRGGIVIEQNDPVNASRAILERIMSVGFDQTGWSPATKKAAERLEQWPIEKLSGFIIHAARREAEILKIFRERFDRHEADLLALPEIRTRRLAKNHGQFLAMLDALRLVLPLRDEQHDAAATLVRRMTVERQLAINSDHPVVELFWDRFDWIEANQGDNPSHPIDHHRQPDLIAISLPEFEERCASRRLEIPSHAELKKHLKTSKSRRFVEAKNVNSVTGKILHCWVFQRPGAPPASR
jgi:hypothetical protein